MSGTSVELNIFRNQLQHLLEEGNRVMLHLPGKETDRMHRTLNQLVAALAELDKTDA